MKNRIRHLVAIIFLQGILKKIFARVVKFYIEHSPGLQIETRYWASAMVLIELKRLSL